MTQRLSPLPDTVIALRGKVRGLTQAIDRYCSPLPSEIEVGRSEDELRIADSRELRYRRRLRIGLHRIARRYSGAGMASQESLKGLADRYLPSGIAQDDPKYRETGTKDPFRPVRLKPPRGDRLFQPTLAMKRDKAIFAGELACLVRPAFAAALDTFHDPASPARRRDRATAAFREVCDEQVQQWVYEPDDDLTDDQLDSLPEERILVSSRRSLLESIDSVGLACLGWLLGKEPSAALRQELVTFLNPTHGDCPPRRPHIAAAIFAAQITGCGVPTVIAVAKKQGSRFQRLPED